MILKRVSAPRPLQYRLDNSVDSEWLDTGHLQAIYSNIPAGKHAFHVRACNRDGIWDRAGMIVYSITQQPYFYETAWFRLAVILAGDSRTRVSPALIADVVSDKLFEESSTHHPFRVRAFRTAFPPPSLLK